MVAGNTSSLPHSVDTTTARRSGEGQSPLPRMLGEGSPTGGAFIAFALPRQRYVLDTLGRGKGPTSVDDLAKALDAARGVERASER